MVKQWTLIAVLLGCLTCVIAVQADTVLQQADSTISGKEQIEQSGAHAEEILHPEKGEDTEHVSKNVAHDEHADEHHVHLNGAEVSLIWVLPFLGILLSIAIFPLVASHFWHHHYGKVSLFWWLAFMIPFTVYHGIDMGFFYLLEVNLGEFVPFIILLFSLFTIAGGIRLKGSLTGSPFVNTIILIIGTALASWMGTTGAAMLLIRPLIRANNWRKYRIHTIVFFIFLVANIGGSLTPLGDPPLFLGFLKGVKFFWTTTHMLVPMLFVSGILLVLYFVIDTILYKKENVPPEDDTKERLGLEGKWNFLLLLGVVCTVVISGIWKSDIENPDHVIISAYGTGLMTKGVLFQVTSLIILALISLKITKKETRAGNAFTWEPILEVAKLFATIFITMVAPIAILRAGTEGALAPVINSVSNEAGPVNSMYFWCTGVLSSFLDNAPTYVVFFNTAGGDANHLMYTIPATLLAISCGAVFMGANTYIGNAPNFMVRSIAEENKIKMPSFFGYMMWSVGILVPIFFLVTFIFF
jgi:Na+/H+ antiporter NhaD/arsenite permease-like protein